jgi:hypothetical protein
VPAIVLDHEQADQKAGRRQRQQQGQPVALAQAQPHRQPERRERCRRQRELGQSASRHGLPVGCKLLFPVPWLDEISCRLRRMVHRLDGR